MQGNIRNNNNDLADPGIIVLSAVTYVTMQDIKGYIDWTLAKYENGQITKRTFLDRMFILLDINAANKLYIKKIQQQNAQLKADVVLLEAKCKKS